MNRQLFHNMVAQYKKETIVSGGKDSDIVEWSGGVHCALPSLKFYGLSQQYGTPTPESPAWIYGFTGPCMVHNGPYFNTPPLHGIGDRKDEWDYVSGKGIRRIREIVLDGANNAVASSATAQYAFVELPEPCYSNGANYVRLTHFEARYGVGEGNAYIQNDTTLVLRRDFSNVPNDERNNHWNAWLAEQYANGTPVTVYYALAEPIPFEERPDYAQYQAIPNESGKADIIDSGMDTPFEVTYITHSMNKNGFERVTISSTNGSLQWSSNVSYSLPSLKIYGKSEQQTTPTPDASVEVENLTGTFKENNTGVTFAVPELCGIEEYADEWDYVTGKGVRRVYKIVLDGINNKVHASSHNSSTGLNFANIRTSYAAFRDTEGGRLLSTHFKGAKDIGIGNTYVGGIGDWKNKQIYFVHPDQTMDKSDKWNNWLKAQYDAGTPVTFYYVLEEPQPFEERPEPYSSLPNGKGNLTQISGTSSASKIEATYIRKE